MREKIVHGRARGERPRLEARERENRIRYEDTTTMKGRLGQIEADEGEVYRKEQSRKTRLINTRRSLMPRRPQTGRLDLARSRTSSWAQVELEALFYAATCAEEG